MRSLAALTALSLVTSLAGCVIYVDHDGDTYVREYQEKPRGPHIGVVLEDVSQSLASQTNVDRGRSTLISEVVIDSPADRAGLKRFDIITAVDGKDNASPSAVRETIRNHKPGEPMSFRVIREGHPTDVTVTP